ncbi:MAG: ABC transporter permease [Candidatus Nanoarchaeia archaeon]|nr:ABC transporter permease [Candidatus Nanoarchaeia archaeon]
MDVYCLACFDNRRIHRLQEIQKQKAEMIEDYFRLAFKGIARRKLRSWLTLIGIFIGITAVVSLITLSQAMQDAITGQFEKLGSNRVMITPGGKSYGPTAGSVMTAKFYDNDVDAVRKVKGVDDVLAPLIRTAQVEFKGEIKAIMAFAYPTGAEFIRLLEKNGFIELEQGRMFRTSDRYTAIMGYTNAHDDFDKDVKSGDKIKINGYDFQVIGIREKSGTFQDIAMGIPLDAGREIFDEKEEVSSIFAIIKDGYDAGKVAEDIKKELRKERNVEEGEEDFTVNSPQALLVSVTMINDVVKAVLIGIAAVSILVGGIGIMNTMYTSVAERTKEIGIMKATGARNSSIMMLFLFESGLLGLIGGVFGLLAGYGISILAGKIAMDAAGIEVSVAVTWGMVIGALAFSFVLGALSGMMPARKASRLQPVEALRR